LKRDEVANDAQLFIDPIKHLAGLPADHSPIDRSDPAFNLDNRLPWHLR
jgi:hypothetical protein